MEEDEGASLFDGMEFVSSDALASPTHDASIAAIDAEIDDLLQPSSAGPKSISLHADSSDTANSTSLEAGGGSNKSLSSPLDAELFSAALTSDPILTLPSEALTKVVRHVLRVIASHHVSTRITVYARNPCAIEK